MYYSILTCIYIIYMYIYVLYIYIYIIYIYIYIRVHGGLVVSVQDCQSRGSGFKFQPGQKFCLTFLLHLHTLANSAMMSKLTEHCQWEDETVRRGLAPLPHMLRLKK